MRIRNGLTQATYAFFQENGFLYVHAPVITATDCDGSGESFVATTLIGRVKHDDRNESASVKLETIKGSIKEKSKQVEELKRSESNKEALAAAVQDLKKTAELVSQLEAKQRQKSGKSVQTNAVVNFSEDFFSCKTNLSVSGRLHLESYASALGNVYSFGPRFSTARSESKKLLAEMWMVETEMAFSQLEVMFFHIFLFSLTNDDLFLILFALFVQSQDSMECAVDFLKFVCRWILENCAEDLKFVAKRVDKLVLDRLQLIAAGPFEKISYTEAVKVLKQVNFELNY